EIQLRDCVPDLLAVEGAGAPDALEENLAASDPLAGLIRDVRAGEFLPVQFHQFAGAWVLPSDGNQSASAQRGQLWLPLRRAVHELGRPSQQLAELRQIAADGD